jgi:hypothetical protein
MTRRSTPTTKSRSRVLSLTPKRTRAERAAARRYLSILKATATAGSPAIRATKMKLIKRSVRVHAYENDLKLSIAVERMARQIAG